jgi:hypothetical protein
MARTLTCTCCGQGLRNNAVENVCFDQVPYPQDDGFGQCRSCFGDNSIDPETIADDDWITWKKHLGSIAYRELERNIMRLDEGLSPVNRKSLNELPWWKQAHLALDLRAAGVL